MTARAKPYAAALGSVAPIRIASGPFAASTAPAITGQVPGETDLFIPVIRKVPWASHLNQPEKLLKDNLTRKILYR